MLKNYLIVALRFFIRQRGFSIINISGLTIGIASSLLILLYIQDEVRYDRFHEDSDRIFRIAFEGKYQGKPFKSAQTGFPVAGAVQKVDEVESVMRVASWKTFPVRYGSRSFTEDHLLLADSSFFNFFSFKLIEGNEANVLSGDRKLVLSESAARKYFDYKGKGDRTAIGKTMELAQGYTAQVAGIAEDAPTHSHFHYSIILSLCSWEKTEPKDWVNGKVITYYKLKPNTEQKAVETKIHQVLQENLNRHLSHLRNTDLEEYKKQGNELNYFIQPLTSIHLKSKLNDEIETNGNIQYIFLFGSIAIFVTLLACINFMNLTTARSATRAKEVAVRKTVGAQNDRLIFQFLMESYFYVITAVVLALFIVMVALVPFNYFSEKAISFSVLFSLPFLTGILAFVFITGLIAGSYPAFYLTHFSPVEVLKGKLRSKMRSYGIRNVLVVFQFFISSTLIIATLVVYEQLRYIELVDVGFDKNNVINLLHTRNLGENGKSFKDELTSQPFIESASYCNRLPPFVDWQSMFRPDGVTKDFSLAVYEMDYDHLATLGYSMASGRFFARDQNDTHSLIVNETAARKLGIHPDDKKIIFTNYDQPNGRNRHVIGIIRDFNFQSLKDPIQPLAIILGNEPNWEMAIRIKPGNDINESLREIKKIYNKHAPGAPFEYSLLAANFDSKQATEKRIALLFIFFTILAIIIACLGLFGLASFTAEQQRKAIGIRKVLGASVTNIVRHLNKEFLTLVLVANLIAWPVSGFLMYKWLSQFAYHVSIPWWTFLAAACITFFIAFISISSKAFGAASGNPVNSLRNE